MILKMELFRRDQEMGEKIKKRVMRSNMTQVHFIYTQTSIYMHTQAYENSTI
jgi:hypothetical protein